MNSWLKDRLEKSGVKSGTSTTSGRQDPAKILLVDDTPTNLQVLSHALAPLGFKILAAKSGPAALKIAKRMKPELVLLDIMMPEMDGYEVCRLLKEDPDTRGAAVIFCSALDDTESKVKGLELGAVDFITKPFQPEEVIARVTTHLAVQQLAASLEAQNHHLQKELDIARAHQKDALDELETALLGESSGVKLLRAAVSEYAKNDQALLIHGASRCGEEAVARAIHAQSDRNGRAFFGVDCSEFMSLSGAGIEEPSPLGERYKLAAGGTLFLDRIQLLPSSLQEELLQWIEKSEEDGEDSALTTRLIAFSATEAGPLPNDFHPILAGRLNKNTLHLPHLKERGEDVSEIAQSLLERHARRLGRSIQGFSAETLQNMQSHSWPGNLRELEDVVVRGISASRGPVVHVESTLLDGNIAIGGYRLQKKLGEGGMGEVWLAKHQLLVRPAAIKLIRSVDGAKNDTSTERFKREATATARLCSPNTVTLYDFGVSDNGDFYYVMELLDGFDLDALIRKKEGIHPGRVARFLIDACHSLAEAHSLGLVHRDIKPANMFIARLGLQVDVLKVLDFGLVGNREDTDETRLTREGLVYGTPDYIAPEVAMDSTTVDGKSDIYCLGASAYAALTGAPPFSGTTMQVLMKHVRDEPAPLPAEVPQALSSLIMKCLSKDPKDRPSALSLWQELRDSDVPATWSDTDAERWWTENHPAESRTREGTVNTSAVTRSIPSQ